MLRRLGSGAGANIWQRTVEVRGSQGDESEGCPRVDVRHAQNLRVHWHILVLVDAQTVDSEVSQFDLPAERDGISNRLSKFGVRLGEDSRFFGFM